MTCVRNAQPRLPRYTAKTLKSLRTQTRTRTFCVFPTTLSTAEACVSGTFSRPLTATPPIFAFVSRQSLPILVHSISKDKDAPCSVGCTPSGRSSVHVLRSSRSSCPCPCPVPCCCCRSFSMASGPRAASHAPVWLACVLGDRNCDCGCGSGARPYAPGRTSDELGRWCSGRGDWAAAAEGAEEAADPGG